jgi:small-conductance mechanosensitive channel
MQNHPAWTYALRKLLIQVAIWFAAAFAASAFAAEQPSTIEQYNQQLDRTRATLDEIEKALAQPTLSDGELKILRDKVDPLPRDLQDAIDKLSPRLRALQARLDELGAPSAEPKPQAPEAAKPKPAVPQKAAPTKPAAAPDNKAQGATKPPTTNASGAKQSPAPDQSAPPPDANSAAASVNAEMAEQRKLYDDTDATLKRARALLLEAQQTIAQIGARQRALFTQTLFLRTSSLFAPSLWSAASREFPGVAFDAREFLAARAANVEARLSGPRFAEFVGVLLLILVAIPPAWLLSRRVLSRNGRSEPTEETKVLGAAWTALALAAIPIGAIGAFALALDGFDLVDATLEPLANALVSALLRVAAIYAVTRAILSPKYPKWRLFDLDDGAAIVITRLVTTIAVVLAVTYIFEQLEEAVQAALPVVIVTRGVGVLIAAALLGVATLALWRKEPEDDGVGLTSTSAVDATDRLRFFGLAAIVAIIGACGAGYVTFASFAIARAGWLLAVGAALYLIVKSLQTGAEWAFAPKSPLARTLMSGVGLRRDSLAQISILLNGLIGLAGFVVAALVALNSFGLQSEDFFSRLEATFYSLKIGDVTISLSAIVTAVALFAATLAATHGLKRWLETRYLPLTRLDAGLRNSIVTSVGYVGFILAASLVLAQLGLGFDRIAIVAGALSVGIGFGLQSIVNNFVSGLILLWERAIRVGDWVVIGDEQGYVKRINVRTTEVETFDRATMIVPNSNLVAGVVKNWLRGDKVGRIKIALAPHAGVDPEEMRDILLSAARAQEGVLRIPAPQVMFLGMEANTFRFELWCYVEDVEQATRVRSDLHFDLHKRLAAAGITIAAASSPAPAVVELAGLDKFMAAAVATAIAASEGALKDASENKEEAAPKKEVREAS